MEVTIRLWTLAIVLVMVGLAGLFLPVIPGAVVLFTGLAVAAWAEDFVYVGWGTLTILGVLALLTYPAARSVGRSTKLDRVKHSRPLTSRSARSLKRGHGMGESMRMRH